MLKQLQQWFRTLVLPSAVCILVLPCMLYNTGVPMYKHSIQLLNWFFFFLAIVDDDSEVGTIVSSKHTFQVF